MDAVIEKSIFPYTNYGKIGRSFVTRQKKRFQYSFIMEEASDTNARVSFKCGEMTGNIYIDNVSLIYTDPSGITDTIQLQPGQYTLSHNFPNPFNPETLIQYTIPEAGLIELSVFNIAGQKIANLVNEIKQPGEHSAVFDGHPFASGIYYYQLKSGSKIITRRMVLMK